MGSATPSSSGGSPDAAIATGGCAQAVPSLTDYSMNGPFTAAPTNANTGPGNGYTVVQPTTLGSLNGAPFKHPIITWGNGVGTSPSAYAQWLNLMATHGFVVIASNSSTDTGQDLSEGLDWMVQQNTVPGPYEGVLDTKCLFTAGHSLGGIAAINAGSHANVAATVVLHSGGIGGSVDAGAIAITPAALQGPLFIFTSDTDGLCPPSTCVQVVFDDAPVQSFVADLTGSNNDGHIIPLSSANLELPGTMAWLRLWAYRDQGAKAFFWGSNATLCASPWACQSKQASGPARQSGF
ncbi:MAG: hypothetical protein ACRENE_24920 [Polyangiaceae bacterium]